MTLITREFDEKQALRYPLFQDDFGEQGDRVLTDEIRTTRKQYICCECLSAVHIGTRCRYHAGIYGGRLMAYRFCSECCQAMSLVFNGDEDAMDSRSEIRAENEKKSGDRFA